MGRWRAKLLQQRAQYEPGIGAAAGAVHEMMHPHPVLHQFRRQRRLAFAWRSFDDEVPTAMPRQEPVERALHFRSADERASAFLEELALRDGIVRRPPPPHRSD